MEKRKILVILLLICIITIFPIHIFAQNGHTHTDKCYNGTRHICDGSSTQYGACYQEQVIEYHKHTNSCYQTVEDDCTHTIDVIVDNQIINIDYLNCPKCNEPNFYGYIYSFTCDKNGENIVLYAGYCDKCGYEGNSTIKRVNTPSVAAQISYSHKISTDKLVCGKTTDTIEKTTYLKTCKKENGAYYDSNGNKVEPTCNSVIVDIKAKNPTQTTNNPDFTLIATYLDGHTSEIKPTIAEYSSNKQYKNEQIRLSYTGIITKAGQKGTLVAYLHLTTPTPSPTTTPTITPTPTPTPTSTQEKTTEKNTQTTQEKTTEDTTKKEPETTEEKTTEKETEEKTTEKITTEEKTSATTQSSQETTTNSTTEEKTTQNVATEENEELEKVEETNNKFHKIITTFIIIILILIVILGISGFLYYQYSKKDENDEDEENEEDNNDEEIEDEE